MDKVLFASGKSDWGTPQWLFDKLNDEFEFVLDAAASVRNAKCEAFFSKQDDGLSRSWDVGGAVFCNPPYGREVGKWVRKAYRPRRKAPAFRHGDIRRKTKGGWLRNTRQGN